MTEALIGAGCFWKRVSKIIENIVININDKLVLNDRLDEEKTLGIIKKIEKGFKTPPEK